MTLSTHHPPNILEEVFLIYTARSCTSIACQYREIAYLAITMAAAEQSPADKDLIVNELPDTEAGESGAAKAKELTHQVPLREDVSIERIEAVYRYYFHL